MNLQILRRSRRRPEAGDIFVLKPRDHPYLYGRVITTHTSIGGITGWPLIYIYDQASPEKDVVPPLCRDRLLIPPLITNYRPWSMGYFERLTNIPLGPQDRFAAHAFKDIRGSYVDECARRTDPPSRPAGYFGLHSFRTIDDEVSKALGLRPAAN